MDKEKRPHIIHYHLSLEVKLLVVVIRTLLGWGAHRISAELERRDISIISHNSVNRIFHQYYLPTKTYHPKGKSDGVKHRRYRRRVSNELWHLDFKGPIKLLSGTQVYLLIVIDDFSRFCLGVHICESACTEAVKQALEQDFDSYGKPQEVKTSNATAFTTVWQDSTGQLDAYLQGVGVQHKLISAYYPESNGKAEAFIKILSAECLQMKEFADVQELSEFVNRFITYYNQYRAHGGLGYEPPIHWYLGTSPKVKGLGGIWGLERVAQEWSGESFAEAPILVNQQVLARRKALVPTS
jgi:transposase InsO family protein